MRPPMATKGVIVFVTRIRARSPPLGAGAGGVGASGIGGSAGVSGSSTSGGSGGCGVGSARLRTVQVAYSPGRSVPTGPEPFFSQRASTKAKPERSCSVTVTRLTACGLSGRQRKVTVPLSLVLPERSPVCGGGSGWVQA